MYVLIYCIYTMFSRSKISYNKRDDEDTRVLLVDKPVSQACYWEFNDNYELQEK